MKVENDNIGSIHFYTLDGAIIPESEILAHRNNIPFVMNIKHKDGIDQYTYALNLNENFSIVNDREDHGDRTSEEAYLTYCRGIGLPQYSSFLLANLANKLHHTLPHGTPA